MTQIPTAWLPPPQADEYGSGVEFRILGPVQVAAEGEPISLGGPKQRLVLALLIMESNRTVPADRLIDRIWGDEPPEAARSSLQAYVSRLRRSIGAGRIESRSPGYVLHAEPEEIDALRFERAIADARRRLGDDPQAAKATLDQALAMWRGPALADLEGEITVAADSARLEEMRVAALEDRAEADLALGHHTELIPELERLLADHPMRERLWESLMLALYRAGRQADALGAYQRARRLLRDELGIDPSSDLQRLQDRILKQDPDLDLRGRRLRGYELIERIGDGAFGVVHRAYQAGVGRDVAIKVIHRRLANQPEFVRRFEQEARLVARLEHPHIVPLYDYWREPDGAYLAMRYLRGGSLKDVLETDGPMAVGPVARVLDQVTSALDSAHRQGVIHGDVRPANVLFDEDRNAYLSDFGIAKEVATAGALNRRVGGLAFYLAPEEIRDEAPSPATDIYSLGLVLYELLAGEHPFQDTPPSEVRNRQLHTPVPRIDLVRPDLPEAVSAVIERATAKAPAARFAQASEVAAAFQAALEGESSNPAAAGSIGARNPYKGLQPFDEADTGDFFGREELTARLVARLGEAEPKSRFLAVVGPSGSGKSSVVRAGLVPALRAGALAGSDAWFVATMQPGAKPFEELERTLLAIALSRPPSLLEELLRDERGLARAVGRLLPRDDTELLIVIDQFEELFTLVDDDQLRTAFLDALVAAVNGQDSRVRFVITLRADFYDRPLLHRDFGELLADRTEAIVPMGSDEIERAIVEPAARVGVTVESHALLEIQRDVHAQPASLPLLQYALTELFERRAGDMITAESYGEVGGMAGALGRRAEALFGRFDAAGKAAVRQLFLRLVRLGDEGADDTRRRVPRRELSTLDVERAAVELAIDRFGAHHLLTFDRDAATRGPTVELAHEALLRAWPRFRDWIADAREDLTAQRRFATEAAQWEESGRDPSFLLRGARLDQAEIWRLGSGITPTSIEREYLEESRRQRDEDSAAAEAQARREASLQRRAVTRLRALVTVLLAGVLVVGGLAWAVQRESRIATARAQAAAAAVALNQDVEQSLRLALESAETMRGADGTVLPETEEVLHAALQADRLVMTLAGSNARFSVDGDRLLLAGPGAAAFEVHDAATGERLTRQEVGHVGDATFEGLVEGYTSDGKIFVAAMLEGGRGITAGYETSTGKRIWTAERCCNPVVVTPDDTSFAIYASPERIDLVDVSTGSVVNWYGGSGTMVFAPDQVHAALLGDFGDSAGPIAGYVGKAYEPQGGLPEAIVALRGPGSVFPVADWSPDGTTLATAASSTATLWDPTSGLPRFSFGPQSDAIIALAFSPDSSRIATGLSDGTTVVWDLSPTGAAATLQLAGHDGPVTKVAFNPDGKRLVTSGADGKVKIWDLTEDHVAEWLTAPCSYAVAFSNDGGRLACGLDNGHVAVFGVASGSLVTTLHGHIGHVMDLEFAPKDTRLVSAGADGTARIWAVEEGKELRRITLDAATIVDVRLSPDGTILALAEQGEDVPDGGILLYELDSGARIAMMPNGSDTLYVPNIAVDFSPDGRLLAGAGFSAVVIWSVDERRLVAQLRQWNATAVAFNTSGERLVVVGSAHDSSITAWKPSSGDRTELLPGTMGEVTDVAFSRDGSRMATSSTDGTIRLWRGDRLEQIMTLATDAAGSLTFSPDGSRLAYTTNDGMVRVLALRTEDLIELARARLSAP